MVIKKETDPEEIERIQDEAEEAIMEVADNYSEYIKDVTITFK